MPKNEKVKVNVKERVDENFCDLSLSELSEIPVREITSFKRVTSLDLSSNRLITLGKNFTSLTRLVKVDLSKNQIKYLPEDFGLLRNLRHLDLYDNKLEHLPLSFGSLTNLRYLDLKGNPLTPALAKIVGFCLTTKECHDSARDTVKFLARMQNEAEKAKLNFLKTESDQQNANANDDLIKVNDEKSIESLKSKKSNKKTKSKTKKSNSISNNNNKSEVTKETSSNSPNKPNTKLTAKGKKIANGNGVKKSSTSSAALTSILTFFLLLTINILIIYMIMFKNPEIAEKLIEFIPQKYRDWILTKTEIFRLGVSDWISEFRTSPEEY